MKLYCILLDAMPLTNHLLTFSELKKAHLFRQIGECYTFASLNSMFTGKLGCDLIEEGLGWETWRRYHDVHRSKSYLPWSSQLLPEILMDNGWQVYLHNNPSIYKNLVGGDRWEDLSIVGRCKMVHLYKPDSETMNIFEKEKKYIQQIQAEKTDQNKMYFFYYDHFHYSLQHKLEEEDTSELACKQIYELMEYWDLAEPDAMFWFFGDHGPGETLVDHPTPEHYLSWAMCKDNLEPPIDVKSQHISIGDFYATVVDRFKLDYASKVSGSCSIQEPQDPDRIYYLEDARAMLDRYNATTAVACKFVDWSDDIPRGILQVSYHEPDNSFVCRHTILDKHGFINDIEKTEMDSELKKAVRSRIGWIAEEGDYKKKERWRKIYSECEPGKLLQIVVYRENMEKNERINFSVDEEILQVSSMAIPRGKEYAPHIHIKQDKSNGVCQEAWVVIRGNVAYYLYDLDGKLLASELLRSGDCVMTFHGGHGYECVSDDSLVYEFKTGPYLGGDKSFIKGKEETQGDSWGLHNLKKKG